MSGAEPAASATAWEARRARPADARACYRYILGRDEADEGLLTRHAEAAGTIGALRGRFLGSEEFRQSLLAGAAEPEGPAPEVELAADGAQLAQMLVWTRRAWQALGESAPHWSVLPEDCFRPERIGQNLRAFQASGAADAAGLLAALARCGVAAGEVPRLVEHGSGVGRVTPHLAAHFPEIACVDISPPHLSAARAEMKRRGLVHLRFLRAKEAEPMPGPEEGYDLWYSRRALQWNPPPVIRQVLAAAFAGLAPRGVAVFQVPVWRAGYRFAAAEYLEGRPPAEPELHLLPQAEVFALAAGAGMRVLGAWDDSHLAVPRPGPWRSTLFVMRKAG